MYTPKYRRLMTSCFCSRWCSSAGAVRRAQGGHVRLKNTPHHASRSQGSVSTSRVAPHTASHCCFTVPTNAKPGGRHSPAVSAESHRTPRTNNNSRCTFRVHSRLRWARLVHPSQPINRCAIQTPCCSVCLFFFACDGTSCGR